MRDLAESRPVATLDFDGDATEALLAQRTEDQTSCSENRVRFFAFRERLRLVQAQNRLKLTRTTTPEATDDHQEFLSAPPDPVPIAALLRWAVDLLPLADTNGRPVKTEILQRRRPRVSCDESLAPATAVHPPDLCEPLRTPLLLISQRATELAARLQESQQILGRVDSPRSIAFAL